MSNIDLKAFNVEINNDALAGKELPTRIKVLNWGSNTTNDGVVYLNDESLKVFSNTQKKIGRDEDVAIDFEHNSVPDSKEWVAGQARDIAGYGDPELIKDDGLYLTNITWTAIGRDKARNYKDLSPACPITKDGVVVGLHSVALTTNGAVYGLKFYSANENEMIKLMAIKNYNKDDANAGLKEVGDKYVANPQPMSSDEEALAKTKELEQHEQDEIDDANNHPDDCMCAMCINPGYSGADDGWTESEHKAHKDLVKDFSADDHYSKYGDVKYADETNSRYPIDTEKHIRAAWSYVNMPKNARKLGGKLSEVKSKIQGAMKKIGAKVETKNTEDLAQTETMSANTAQPYTNMSEIKVKTMDANAPESVEDKGGKSDSDRILFALLAKFIGEHPEFMEQLTKKSTSQEGGLNQWSASSKIDKIENEMKTFKAELSEKQIENERQSLVAQATKEGKVISLSANAIKKLDVAELKEYVAKLEPVVPMKSKMKMLSASNAAKPSREAAISKFNEMLKNA